VTMPDIRASAPVGPDGAPLLVLGCSLGTSSILWERALPLLAQRFRVSVWDLPGHGAAPASADAFSVAELADAVAGAYSGDFLYAGVSLGGAVALELALRYGRRVRAVAAMCSGARIGTPDGWAERAAQVRAAGTGSLLSVSAARWFAPGTIADDPDLTGRLLHALRDADDESYARCCDALARFDVRERLGDVRVPVLALWGEHDAVTPEGSAEEIGQGVRHARVGRVDGASHLAPVDAPAETARLLEDFFTRSLTEVGS